MHDFVNSLNANIKDGFYEIIVEGNIPLPELSEQDRILLPVDEGIAVPVNEKLPVPENKTRLCSREGTMGMLIIQRNSEYLLVVPEKGFNSFYTLKWNGVRYELTLENEKCASVRYMVCESLSDACKAYRKTRPCDLSTLKDKLKKLPEAEKLKGGAIFWIWNNHFDKVMYAEKNTELNPEAGESILEIADDLHKNGVDKAMIGIFFNGDGKYVEPLYKKHGFICTQYDNYDDVMNPELLKMVPSNRVRNCDYTARRMKDYPKGVIVNKDGTLCNAWALKGFDGKYYNQNKMCPEIVAQRMKEEIPEILKEYPYYKARFIDVYGCSLSECYSKEHPVTIEECAKIKNGAFSAINSFGLITGTEDGSEELIENMYYTEGLHSPSYLRIYDSGRRYAYMYTEEECKTLNSYMLNPKYRVPMWQLVYHENLLIFPYWGDSTGAAPSSIKRRILFACLFGCAPLYSFFVKNYASLKDYIIESYGKITKVHEKVAELPMTDYSVLTEDFMVQTTVFGDKYRVVANFKDSSFKYNGKDIPAGDFLFEEV